MADIPDCRSRVERSPFDVNPGVPLVARLAEGTTIPLPGFPSLRTLPIASCRLEAIKLNEFGSASRYNTLVIKLGSPPTYPVDPNLQLPYVRAIAEGLLDGRTVFVNYPYLHEAKVVALSYLNNKISKKVP